MSTGHLQQINVPSGWEFRRFDRIADRCKAHGDPEGEPLSVFLDDGVIPRSYRDDNFNRLGEDLSRYLLVRKGDIVFNKLRTWQGGLGHSRFEGIVSPAYFVMRPDKAVADSRYLHYLLRSKFYLGELTRRSKWMPPSQFDITWDQLRTLPILVPPLPVQRTVADYLDRKTATIDELTRKKERLVELLQEKRQALITQAVTKGLDPSAPMKGSGIKWLGEIPAHWEEYPLKALCRLKNGFAFDGAHFSDSGRYILMTPGNFLERGGFRSKNPEKYFSGADVPPDFVLRPGQLLVAMTEQAPGLLGSALFVPHTGLYLHNQRIGLVHNVRSQIVTTPFLYYLFNSRRFRAELSCSAVGQKVKHTSAQKILSTKVWLPPIFEQESLVEFLNRRIDMIDDSEGTALRTLDLVREYRQALISAAVTGEVDVPEGI